jgi:two-component system, LytTR family, response regulator
MNEGLNLCVLIVDDEPIARRRLARLLRRIDGIGALHEACDVSEAIAAVAKFMPDVILLDIQMPGGGGFEMLKRLGPSAPPVIFVTAYDRYALRAFDVDAVDYVTKPVDPARLATAIARARSKVQNQETHEQIDELQSTVRSLRDVLAQANRPARSLWIKAQSEYRNIEIDAITHIQAERDYVRIHVDGKAYLHNDTLGGIAQKLSELGFLRVHRSYLVQRRAVLGISWQVRGRQTLRLADGSLIPVGRSYAAAVTAELRQAET